MLATLVVSKKLLATDAATLASTGGGNHRLCPSAEALHGARPFCGENVLDRRQRDGCCLSHPVAPTATKETDLIICKPMRLEVGQANHRAAGDDCWQIFSAMLDVKQNAGLQASGLRCWQLFPEREVMPDAPSRRLPAL